MEMFRSIPHALETTHKDNMETLRHLISLAFREENRQLLREHLMSPEFEPLLKALASLRNRNADQSPERTELWTQSALLEAQATQWVQDSREDVLTKVG